MLLAFRIVGIVDSPAGESAGGGVAFTDTITTYDLGRVYEHAITCECYGQGLDRQFAGHLLRACVSVAAVFISLSFGLALFALSVKWLLGVRFPLALVLAFLFVLMGFAAFAEARRLTEFDIHERQLIDEAERLWQDRGRYRVVREEDWNSFRCRLQPYRAPDTRRALIKWPAYRSSGRSGPKGPDRRRFQL